MDRLTALGLGDQEVPGPAGRTWTARELAVHARAEALSWPPASTSATARRTSATGHARAWTSVRWWNGSPGVRSAARPVGAPVPTPVPEVIPEKDLTALLAEARRLSDTLQPHAVEAWLAVSRAAEGVELSAHDRAEIADHQAMDRGPEGIALFERAAELFAEAGDPGEALAARARGAYVRALTGEIDEALAAIDAPYDGVLALYSEDRTGVRQTAAVLMSRARILMRRVHGESRTTPPPRGAGRRRGRRTGGAGAGRGHTGDDVRLAARGPRGRRCWPNSRCGPGTWRRPYGCSRRRRRRSWPRGCRGSRWSTRPGSRGSPITSVTSRRRSGRCGPPWSTAGRIWRRLGGLSCISSSPVLGGRGRSEEAAEHALEAAHWSDEAGEGPTLGAWARHQLGGFLLRQGRWAEAAEVLESALPDLSAETHGDGAIVQTQWWLGDCLSELGEHRAAAERRLQAAETARHWPEQNDHATLAHLAAESLGHADLPAEADRAYERAGDLWRTLGNVHGLVRSLRARAWLALRADRGLDRARELMAGAIEECEAALLVTDDEEARQRLTGELGHTHRQFGELLARSVAEEAEDTAIQAAFEDALAETAESVTVFAALGEGAVHTRTAAELAAGWLEADLSRPADAAARARGVLKAYEGADDGDETVRSRRAEAEQLLQLMEEQTDK